MSFRYLLSASGLLLAGLCWSVVFAADRNVVLIVVDDQGFEMGCYGNDVIRTPHLDALAASGTRFTQAYATVASCSASRSVILSGLLNHSNGQYGHAHDYHHFVRCPGCEVSVCCGSPPDIAPVRSTSILRLDTSIAAGRA